jgi:basic membrane lipoprotein Med (substrate-binding protein (PBP1-ABC) superfamily)
MIDDGADFIYAYLDAGITGVYQAARESGKDVGVYNIIVPSCEDYDNIVGTATENDTEIIFQAIKRFQEGTLEPGAVFIGLQDPTLMALELCPKYADDKEFSALVDDTIKRINEGELKPSDDVVQPRPDFAYTEGFDGAAK